MRGRIVAGMLVLAALAAVALVLLRGRDGFDGDTRGAAVEHFSVDSRLTGGAHEQTLVTPAGDPEDRPLLVFLHGRNSTPDYLLSDELFAALERLGERAPVIVFANGGESSYYHDRRSGRWGSYVMREVLPAALERSGADRGRLAIGGISMGGFGALDLARLNPGRFCAVGGHSAALWTEAGQTPAGAFDDAADFARHDVVASPPRDSGPVRLDAGRDDPFLEANRTLARSLGTRLVEDEGGHERDYWLEHTDDYLRFYAGALGRCRR